MLNGPDLNSHEDARFITDYFHMEGSSLVTNSPSDYVRGYMDRSSIYTKFRVEVVIASFQKRRPVGTLLVRFPMFKVRSS